MSDAKSEPGGLRMQDGWRFSVWQEGLTGAAMVFCGLGLVAAGLFHAGPVLAWALGITGAVSSGLGMCRLSYDRVNSMRRFIDASSREPMLKPEHEAWIDGKLSDEAYFAWSQARAEASAEKDLLMAELYQTTTTPRCVAYVVGEFTAKFL